MGHQPALRPYPEEPAPAWRVRCVAQTASIGSTLTALACTVAAVYSILAITAKLQEAKSQLHDVWNVIGPDNKGVRDQDSTGDVNLWSMPAIPTAALHLPSQHLLKNAWRYREGVFPMQDTIIHRYACTNLGHT